MDNPDALRMSDAAVVARYLQVRGIINDRMLARVEQVVNERYRVEAAKRSHATLSTLVRGGFIRPGEGEMWPVVFLTAVDISFALCVQISSERLAALGTMLKGPQRLRHRTWEDWWGWEKPLGELHPEFFDLAAGQQEEVAAAWYQEGFDWLVSSGLMRPK